MMPISQEKLNYTPVGETCIAKMAISPNIIVKHSEREISRHKSKVYYAGRYGYLIKVKAEMEFVNLKNEAVNLMVNRNIKAVELLESSEKWNVLRTFRQVFARNHTSEVQWDLVVKANGKKNISYEYEVHVWD